MKNTSTRLLLSCAAIGVAGGLLFIATAYLGVAINGALPVLYGLTLGIYFMPSAVALALFRRPGVAILTATLSGLVSAAFQPLGFWTILIAAGIGLVQEAPFAVLRYRRWPGWLFVMGSVVSGVILAAGMYRLIGAESLDAVGAAILIAGSLVSPVLFTLVALWVARALAATGVTRGLTRPTR